jgi:hypothetical protein
VEGRVGISCATGHRCHSGVDGDRQALLRPFFLSTHGWGSVGVGRGGRGGDAWMVGWKVVVDELRRHASCDTRLVGLPDWTAGNTEVLVSAITTTTTAGRCAPLERLTALRRRNIPRRLYGPGGRPCRGGSRDPSQVLGRFRRRSLTTGKRGGIMKVVTKRQTAETLLHRAAEDRLQEIVDSLASLEEEGANGATVTVGGGDYPGPMPVISGRSATPEEFHEHFGDLPTDDEG